MTYRYMRFSLVVLVAIAVCPMLSISAQSQKGSHPDLSGMWNGNPAGGGAGPAREENGNITTNVASRRCAPNQKGCGEHTNQTVDGEFTGRMDPNRPLYKPEFWDKVQDLDRNTNTMDPLFKCQPYGVPRMGPPTKIVQMANEIIF